jgi:hypothetical protein
MLRLSVKTVRLYIVTGRLAGMKAGKRWLVTEDALHAFMAADHIPKLASELTALLESAPSVTSAILLSPTGPARDPSWSNA